MNTLTIEMEIELVVVECCTCGIRFGLPARYQRQLRELGKEFHCPNGHSLTYGKGEAEKLRHELKQIEMERNRLIDLHSVEQAAHKLAARRLAATKGQLTKLKKRVAAGVCPCCNRTFRDLADHMKTQHPDYEHEGEDEAT